MTSRSEPSRSQRDMADVLDPRDSAKWAIGLAQTPTLEAAMAMLQAQISSRRGMVSVGGLEAHEVDVVAREIQARVERVRLIVQELRRRGAEVDWEE